MPARSASSSNRWAVSWTHCEAPTRRPVALPPLSLFVALLLAWLAIPAVGALLFGIALLRQAPAV